MTIFTTNKVNVFPGTTEERLEKLEWELAAAKHRNRWLLWGGAFVALLVLSCLTIAVIRRPAMSATPGDNRIIRANSFILEDENGKPRASLDVVNDGPVLLMFDENVKTRVQMDVFKNEPRLSMTDESDKNSAQIQMHVDKDGPALGIVDENGKVRAQMSTGKDGPALVMRDENEKARVMMRVVKNGKPRLLMTDENGKPVWTAP